MENAIKKEKDRFEALFEFASIGIVLTDATGTIEMINNYLLSQFGYERKEELIGKKIEVLIPKRYEHKHEQYRENYNKNPERRSMGVGRDLFALKKDGVEFPVEVSLSNYKSDNEMCIIAFVVDITRRKQIEKDIVDQKELLQASNDAIAQLNDDLEGKVTLRTSQLREAMEQLETSRDELTRALNKEKELGDLKSRFVSMASHEFRTPLSTILSSASLLAKYTQSEEQEKRDKHIGRIKTSVNNLTGILNEFLSIGRIEDGKIEVRYERFNVKEFITNLCAEMQAHAKSGQQINYISSGDELILLDASLLRNILFNLLSNAIKFSGENGLIELKTTNSKSIFSISIRDNGIGISEKDQVHLFERFYRASNVTNIQGTGLGLHIVARYAELMKGSISFESELEKGTTFNLIFKIPDHILNS